MVVYFYGNADSKYSVNPMSPDSKRRGVGSDLRLGTWGSPNTYMQYYLLAPILALIFIPRMNRGIHILILLLLLLSFSINIPEWFAQHNHVGSAYHQYWCYYYAPIFPNLIFFGLGWAINPLLRLRSKPLQLRMRWIFVILLLLYLSTAYMIHRILAGQGIDPDNTLLRFSSYFCSIITAIVIYLIEARDEEPVKLTTTALRTNWWRILEWGGILSYGIYLWGDGVHECLQPILLRCFPNHLYFLLTIFMLMLFGSIIVALVTYHGIERPFEKIKKFKSITLQQIETDSMATRRSAEIHAQY